MKKITASDLKAEVIKVARENPDHVYKDENGIVGGMCTYEHNGFPSCIIGHALHRLGMSLEQLHVFDTAYLGGLGIMEVFGDYTDLLDYDNDPNGINDVMFLSSVQTNQDSGIPWGKAVKETKL